MTGRKKIQIQLAIIIWICFIFKDSSYMTTNYDQYENNDFAEAKTFCLEENMRINRFAYSRMIM